MVETTVLKCSEKQLFLSLLGSMGGGEHSYPGVQLATWNVTEDQLNRRYFPANFLKLVTTPILPVRQL